MVALLRLLLALLASPFKSKSRLEAENAALRHQLTVLRRQVRGRVQLTGGDRLFLILLYRWFPSVLKAVTIVQPVTLVRWHRAGFRRYWRWKSRSLGGRPQIDTDLRAPIRQLADFAVLSDDYFSVPEENIQDITAVMTLVLRARSPNLNAYPGTAPAQLAASVSAKLIVRACSP